MDLKEEIKNSIKLSHVVGKNLSLKRRDKSNYVALCPFHKEKTPSFNISDDKGFYHCFGCGKNGDIFNYVMEMENISFVEALKKLAEQAGIKHNSYNLSPDPKITKLLKLLKRVSDSYVQNLNAPIGEKARQYLNERGIDNLIIKNLLIGYSGNSKSNQFLVSCLLKEGFSTDEIVQVGLAKKNQNNNLIFYFQQRIMIPILNNSGKIIAFGGRSLGLTNPKYLNSPETPIFHKGRQLFGTFNAKKILNKNRFLICEGYMDAISLNSFGYPAVASLGTSITEYQIDNIFKITDEAFLVFDGDNAGKRATVRAFEKILPRIKVNKKIKFVFLPDDMDPEDFIKKFGVSEFEKILDKALNIIDMLWIEGLKLIKVNEPETNALFWNFLRNKVNNIEDIGVKLAYRDEIEKRIKIFRNNKDRFFKKPLNLIQKNEHFFSSQKELPKTGIEIKIGAIIYFMLVYPSLCAIFDEKISLINLKNKDLNKLKDLILKSVNNFPEISSRDLQQEMINRGFSVQVTKFMQSNYSSRLKLDANHVDIEDVCVAFEELLNLLNVKRI